MRTPLTQAAMLDQMTRLNQVFGKFSDDDLGLASAGYFESLAEYDIDAVAGGVTLAIKLEGRFPYPAKLRELIKTWLGANRAEFPAVKRQAANGDVVCPTCGAGAHRAWLAVKDFRTKEERMVARVIAPCDATRHPRGSWYVPYPENFVEWVNEDEAARAQPARTGGADV